MISALGLPLILVLLELEFSGGYGSFISPKRLALRVGRRKKYCHLGSSINGHHRGSPCWSEKECVESVCTALGNGKCCRGFW